MVRPKSHLEDIYRSSAEKFDRTRYLRLDKNENTGTIPAPVLEIIKSGITPELISSYPQVYPLYEKLGRVLGLDEDCLLLTAGSDAAIKNVFEVFVNPGDEIIIPDPTYAMYEIYAQLFQGVLQKVPYGADLTFSLDDVYEKITDKTKLIALANPNSPTGCVLDQQELVALIKYAEEKDILLLIDEAYYPYYPHSVIDYIPGCRNLIVTRTFSKAYGLASLRLGFAAANPDTIRSLAKFRPIYETNGLAVLFGCQLLDHPEIISRNVSDITEGREFLFKEMEKMGFSCYPSHTNFLNIRVGQKLVIPLTDHLKARGILIKPGYDHPALKECIRVTIGPIPQMKPVIESIRDYIEHNSQI
ncbi:pyridoxal phosphate-dependent aminotransferase [Methanoregula sp.]|jgi:histidinol-phosphate aminotransferase|uniref:pyridoxal phosphate-dependent aminotransferase n=1 Tax=Methanoregula sp. TaxID=2052170 RepID=UPI003C16374F